MWTILTLTLCMHAQATIGTGLETVDTAATDTALTTGTTSTSTSSTPTSGQGDTADTSSSTEPEVPDTADTGSDSDPKTGSDLDTADSATMVDTSEESYDTGGYESRPASELAGEKGGWSCATSAYDETIPLLSLLVGLLILRRKG